MPKSIKQEVVLNASPAEVYSALMDSRKHGAFTGAPAKISKKVGGAVSCYGGGIKAMNVELVADKRIVQSWRGAQWKPGEWSLVNFNLKKKGKKTALTLEHYGVPDHDAVMVRKGWKDYYWTKMNDYFSKKK
jgi:activator of HSP90 ATPase